MDILKQIADAVTGISEKVFITDRPAAEQKAMKDFVVIRLPQTIQDKGSTYQDTYCQINVFAHEMCIRDRYQVAHHLFIDMNFAKCHILITCTGCLFT